MQTNSYKLGSSLGSRHKNVVAGNRGTDSVELAHRSHIAIITPRGEVIRNFVHSRCLDQIYAEAALSIIAVSSCPSLDIELREKYGDVYGLSEIENPWIVRFQRELLDIAHGRWLWSRAAQRRWKIRDLEARTTGQKIKRILKKTICWPFANKLGLRTLSASERVCSRFLNSSNEYTELYQTIRPTLVFNGSHIHSRNAIQAVQAAQWLGIPTATFIFSWDNLTSQGRIILPYDYFLVWNDDLKKQLLEMYEWIKPENVFVTGTPQFDFHFRPEFYLSRNEFCRKIGADPHRPIVLYATGMPNHMPGEAEIVEEIADILLEFDPDVRPQLLVRVYPKDRSGRFGEIKSRRKDILFPAVEWEEAWLTPKYEDSYDLINTLRHCAVGINVASTISLELCMFDKPVLNVGYNPKSVNDSVISYADYYEFDHYEPVVKSGAIRVANSTAQMRKMIIEALDNPSGGSNERKQLITKMFGTTLDGNSSQRVAETLMNLAVGNDDFHLF